MLQRAISKSLYRDSAAALISGIECAVEVGQRDDAVVHVEEELSVLAGGVALLQLIDVFGMIVRIEKIFFRSRGAGPNDEPEERPDPNALEGRQQKRFDAFKPPRDVVDVIVTQRR